MARRSAQPKPPPDAFAGLNDELNVEDAAKAARVSHNTIRTAIRRGDLKAWIPRIGDPALLTPEQRRALGPGMGYRINKLELKRWLFGNAAAVK